MAKAFASAVTFLALVCAQLSVGLAQQSGSPAAQVAPALKIGAGDLLDVSMFENPDLSGRFRVDEHGDIIVPLLGTLHVEGLTAEEAAVLIEKRFVDAQILQPAEAHATVFISEYATQGITVNGEVKSTGIYPALGVRKLNDVISAAGGVTPIASSKVVITHRSDPGNPVTVDYNPEALPPVVPDVQIFPGDTVMVPRAGIVYAIGDVNHTGAYVLDGRNTLTIEELMALAGGGGHAAAMKRVQLVRSTSDGRKEAITIPVNLILQGKAPDVSLKDGDIVYVPTSNTKYAAETALTSAVGIGSSLILYRASTNQ